MHAETRVARNRVHDQPDRQWAGMAASVFQNPCSVAFAGMDLMTAADWDAAKDEIHRRFEEWQSGARNWQGIRSELETRIAAMEKSIGLLKPGSQNIQSNL